MIDLRPAADRVAELVAGVQDDQLAGPTPCPEMTVGELLDHIATLTAAFTAKAVKSEAFSGPPPRPDADRLGPDWRDRIPLALRALAAAWTEPSAWEGSSSAGGMEFPSEVIGVITLDELIVHGWDVAVSTGQPYEVPESEISTATAFLSEFPAPRDGQLFGPVVPTPDGASPFDRLLGLAGRDPRWEPPVS